MKHSNENIRFFAAALICIALWSCAEMERPDGGKPEDNGLAGLIHMAVPEDYTKDNHIIMLQDDEPSSVFLDPVQRSFDPRHPVQVSVTEDRELLVRAYSPRRILGMKIWASVDGYPEEFLLAQFDIIPPFLEFRTPLPFVSEDKEYKTVSGKTILIMKNPHIGPDDLVLRIECEDPYYRKFADIKTTWQVHFSNFEYPNHSYWLQMKPGHCREAVAMTLNMAYLFSSQEYRDSLQVNDNRFIDNSRNPLSAETLLSQSLTRPSFAWGSLHAVGGLGGGGTLGLQDVCYVGHYADDKSESMALLHEFGHGMGYGHGPNTVISESDGKYSWRQMAGAIYVRMSLSKELPIYSRRFMHSRRDHYDQWSDGRLAYYGAAGRYYRGRYIIEDPELDALDGGLSGGKDFPATDSDGNKGKTLHFRLDDTGAEIGTNNYAPRDIHVYNDFLYIGNDMRPEHYSLDVYDLSDGTPKLLKRITSWTDPETGEETRIGKPTGIYRSYDKLYLSGSGSRIYVFDAATYECIDFIGPSGGAYSTVISEGVVYSISDAVSAMPENLIGSRPAGSVTAISKSARWGNSDNNTLARSHDGSVYAILNKDRKIMRMESKYLMAGRLDATQELTFDNAPFGACFSDDGRMFVSFGNVSGVRFAEVDPENGAILKDLSSIGDIKLHSPGKCLIRRGTIFITDRKPNGFCLYAIPLDDLN